MNAYVHDHVALWCSDRPDGSPVTEKVPARRRSDGLIEVLGTPGIAYGCAAGDVLSVEANGRFEVVRRGGNVAIHLWPSQHFTDDQLTALRLLFEPLRGLVEGPDPARFAVVTVPVTAGFPAIEQAIERFVGKQPEIEWYFGNVRDESELPLNWWNDEK